MRIAVQNCYPNYPHSAEAEWIRRFFIACGRLDFEPVEVVTSDDIIRCQPDCVLVTHQVSPKLTQFPTLSLNWNPPVFFAADHKAVLSMDGYICGSRKIAEWIDDFATSHGKRALLHDGLMLPSSPDSGPAKPLPRDLSVMYVGVHWDGSRHGAVFRELDGRVPLKLYGPAEAWASHGTSYRGTLPFDGVSIINALRDTGIALCLHKAAHREASCPSMRLFEAAAAGALIITDDFEFPREWFRDSVLYVDAELPAPAIVDKIVSHVKWANQNWEAASRLARRSNELFRQRLTLESMLKSLPNFVEQLRERRCMTVIDDLPEKPRPTVEYIIRIGSRSAETVARALESLAAQTYQPIAVMLVQCHPVAGLDAITDSYRKRFRWIRRIVVTNNGSRSTTWWAGLNAVSAEFFGILNDDDTLFSNHVASLMDRFDQDPSYGFIHSGLIKVEEEPGCYVSAPQFHGPAGNVIEERRQILYLEEGDFEKLAPTHSVIGNHSWICRTSLLRGDILTDPHLDWAEDVYFTTLMAGRTKFGFTAMATAVWHSRSTNRDNGTLSYPDSHKTTTLARWHKRLQTVKLPKNNRVSPPNSQDLVEWASKRDQS